MELFPRSASLRVEVEQTRLRPGEVLTGKVTLVVHKPIEAQELIVTFTGTEFLTWDEIHGTYRSNNKKEHEILTLDMRYEIPEALSPGETSYPFSFELSEDLPASFNYGSVVVGSIDCVRVSVEYDVTAKLVRNGILHPDVTESVELVVRPSLRELLVPVLSKPLAANASQQVRAWGVFKQGQCHARMELRSDVIVCPSDVPVTAIVSNESKGVLNDLRVILYEEVEIDRDHNGEKGVQKQSYAIIKHRVDAQIIEGIVNDKPVQLTLPIPPTRPVLPNMTSHFIRSLNYRIAVEASFVTCPRVKVSVPVRVVRKSQARAN
ncbi:hypothetical protein Poli38472_010117 [Pythium oligandrum]|uniref:Arrestin-like N-terminal domain-containing protein n=1 Tax=Pythium oligandrum TaxID=41045 RepID=A0A8K1FH97_PYTOL|nr:hypothetical protein Poli38472_010117 [Pythium oligandrum]|eukprot:TMW58558.1 hypothetical protein Poli38472_010117 [Pythium oligandrum]